MLFSFGKVAQKCAHLKLFLKKFLLTVGFSLSHNDYYRYGIEFPEKANEFVVGCARGVVFLFLLCRF